MKAGNVGFDLPLFEIMMRRSGKERIIEWD
jgi:hypothetical protein